MFSAHSLEPCSIHLTSIHLLLYFLITASHNIHSCNALLSFFIIYNFIHTKCAQQTEYKPRNDLSESWLAKSDEKESFVFSASNKFWISTETFLPQSGCFYVLINCAINSGQNLELFENFKIAFKNSFGSCFKYNQQKENLIIDRL